MKAISRRKFVATAAVVDAGAVLRTPALAFENQNAGGVSAGSAKPVGHELVASQAVPFPMKSVGLQQGLFSVAAEANRKYLEKPDCELRGHFAGGHYLSACALAFASSGDEDDLTGFDTLLENKVSTAIPTRSFRLKRHALHLGAGIRWGCNPEGI